MECAQLFPRALLDRSSKERVGYFKDRTAAHKRLVSTVGDVTGIIKEPGGSSLLYLVGPTGVGKSTVIKRVSRLITEELLSEMEQDPGRIPIATVVAIAPDSGSFNWKDHFIRSLQVLNEPLIDHKLRDPNRDTGACIGLPRHHAPELRRALEKTLQLRKLSAFFVDEAQHLTKVVSGRKHKDQLDCIKSMADLSRTLHVLVGTYELLSFLELSGQLSRRGRVVHFSRYRVEDSADQHEFQTVLNTFQLTMPVQSPPDLLPHWEYCYERSIGCVGVLKDWLTRALSSAIEAGEPTVTLKHLKKHALTPGECRQIASEAVEGENRLLEYESSTHELRRLLGLSKDAVDKQSSRIARAKQQSPLKPGERSPTRDKTGSVAADRQ